MSSQPTIDDQTAEIVQSAMAEARSGRIVEACGIAERGIAEGADAAILNAMLGALHCGAGDFAAAIGPLSEAAKRRPDDAAIKFNLVSALLQMERYAEALAVLTDDVVDADSTMNFLRQRAFAAHMNGELDRAFADYRRFLAANPEDWESWNNLGNAYRIADDLENAIEALRTAARINPRAAPTRLNLARSLRDSGDLEAAEAELRSMARDFPRDEKPLVDLYHVLRALGRPEADWEEALEEAVRRDPANSEVLGELGNHQLSVAKFDKSEATFRRLLDLDPTSADAYLGLAQVFEHSQPERLAALAAEAEQASLNDESRLNLIRAFAARRSKDHEAGLAALQPIPAEVEPAIRWHLAGQMLDASGRFDEAFAAFSAMNDALAEDETDPRQRAADLRARLGLQLDALTPNWRGSWKAPPVDPPRPAPVFLAGFPRSGTTLLDTMMMGHERVVVLEERPIFRQLDLEFGGFGAVAEMTEDSVRQMQQRYFDLASAHVELSDDSLLIDKSPLYLHRVPQILRMFPDARFILALRHPADAVLSCFMANFRLNNAMANFLDLDSAAQFYDLILSLWERSRELFEMDVQTVVYERIVEDPEAELRRVAEGLGLSWDPRMLEHQKTAKKRGVIPTASYAQVTQPLYTSSVDRWKNYREHLEPVLPVLAPWAAKFGYSL